MHVNQAGEWESKEVRGSSNGPTLCWLYWAADLGFMRRAIAQRCFRDSLSFVAPFGGCWDLSKSALGSERRAAEPRADESRRINSFTGDDERPCYLFVMEAKVQLEHLPSDGLDSAGLTATHLARNLNGMGKTDKAILLLLLI